MAQLVAYRGFFTSLRLAQRGLLLNVNICTSTFYPPIMLHTFIDRLWDSNVGLDKIYKLLTNVQVRLIYDRPERDGKTPNAENHRLKFITKFSDVSLVEQEYSTRENPNFRLQTTGFFSGKLSDSS